jgi:hypothetical protein
VFRETSQNLENSLSGSSPDTNLMQGIRMIGDETRRIMEGQESRLEKGPEIT